MTFRTHEGLSLGRGLFEWAQIGGDPYLKSLERDILDKDKD